MGGTLGQPTDTVSSVVQKSVLKTPICFQREQSQNQSKIQNLKLKKEIIIINFIIKKKTPLSKCKLLLWLVVSTGHTGHSEAAPTRAPSTGCPLVLSLWMNPN
jgi:hypothetical protein